MISMSARIEAVLLAVASYRSVPSDVQGLFH